MSKNDQIETNLLNTMIHLVKRDSSFILMKTMPSAKQSTSVTHPEDNQYISVGEQCYMLTN
jgi:hypothetical protein